MLRESSVIALAGLRRFALTLWSVVCLLVALVFIVLGSLKLFGLIIGSTAMLTLNGAVPTGEAAQNTIVHVILMLLFFGLGCLFFYWARLAKRAFSSPFERDLKGAAELVNDIENNAKITARSIRDAARTAVSDAENRGVKGQK